MFVRSIAILFCLFFASRSAFAEEGTMKFPPQNRGGKQPVFVYLHGIAGKPDKGCREFERSVATYGWLVCPRANVATKDGTYSWGGTVDSQWQTVERALESVAAEPEVERKAPIVLLGFSQGAFVAADFIRAYPKRIRAAVLVGAEVRLSKRELEKTSVTKVGFAAGRNDASYLYLRESFRALDAASFATQFRDLGKVGHTYIGEDEATSIDSLVSWIAED
jgi:predicted esterase